MHYLKGTQTFTPTHPLYGVLWPLITVNACIVRGFIVTGGQAVHGESHRDWKVGDHASFDCAQFPLAVSLPIVGPIELAIGNTMPSEFQILIADPRPVPDERRIGRDNEVVTDLFADVLAPFFAVYTDPIISRARSKYGRDVHQWPPLLNFCRVVRNAISHGGVVSFDNDKAKPVTWHGLQVGPTDNGSRLIGERMKVGDLLILMLEINDDLARLTI